MPDNINKKVLLIGASQMAIDYYKVLQGLSCEIITICRTEKTAEKFRLQTQGQVITGGLEQFLNQSKEPFDAAIVAVGMEYLADITSLLLENNFKNILVEKPGGLNSEEIKKVAALAKQKKGTVLVAYNRRFYSSVLKAKEIIKQDGGLTSFNFEFTEWAHTIEPLKKAQGVKENWLLANSTHVIDLAFYIGGIPTDISTYASGKLSWHDKAVFSGAGKTEQNILFSYQANWAAPGRWGVEFLTAKSRLILRPMEELQIQSIGSVAINKVELNNANDIQFKPGLFLQVKNFLNNTISEFKTIEKQAEISIIYDQIAKGNRN